ncbi:response regulator [Acuticoccus sp. I52.16.1]|uniref:response regulator n=1 Tax=Acuticoccus sp. I52.16.1 TaxID=2928472 RepID=UPI001FD1F390|nr:response regulator [Acuticoccus sp. I52.16.1]UOM34759.1 response regulator [Acuticoccus sp. I52.16.1]
MSGEAALRILHVEQNPADVALVREYLSIEEPEQYVVVQVTSVEDGLDLIGDEAFDALLLHVRLATDGVQSIRRAAQRVPVIVITGYEDETLALEAIAAGAQDYLFKNDLSQRSLRRSIGFAISRKREAEIRALNETLSRLKLLASEGSATSVTARALGVGPLKTSAPEVFDECVGNYARLMKRYIMAPVRDQDEPRDAMERLVTRLGDLGAGPKDMIDLHAAALEEAALTQKQREAGMMIVEGRLFALEIMGLLVNYYRIGHRRLTWGV